VRDGSSERGAAILALTLGAYVVLFGLGVLTGVVGTFLVPERIGSFGYLSTIVSAGGNLVVGLLGGIGMDSRAGAVTPFFGWFIAVGLLATEPFVSKGGDIVIPGTLGNAPGVVHAGVAFMAAGVLAAVVPIVITSRYTERVKTPKSLL
jgi:hypothetical protein